MYTYAYEREGERERARARAQTAGIAAVYSKAIQGPKP